MKRAYAFLAVATVLFLLVALPAGCPGPGADTGATNTNPSTGSEGTNDSTTGGTTNTGTTTGTDSGAVTISGRLAPGQAAKRRPRAELAEYPYTVVAQSDKTGQLLRVETEEDGGFTIDVPDSEKGNSFMVTILGPDGRAVGPVTFGQTTGGVTTGLKMTQAADLGTIDLPDDPTGAPIQPGSDGNAATLADPDVSARTNTHGAPIGLAGCGKSADAMTSGQTGTHQADADQDGLIDMLDADDDGDGIVDDFDGKAGLTGVPADTRANFFMNLKISADVAPAYYGGDVNQIATRLAEDTIITFEVMTEPTATRHITAANLLETPGPAYLPSATVTNWETSTVLWRTIDYSFTERADRFDTFIVPHAVMAAGDTFTVEVAFDNGTTEQYSRMLNFIFKNIPRLVNYGAPGSLTAFSVTDTTINGTSGHPIPFDGTKDLVLEFVPPLDENGQPLTGMYYTFQVFYGAPPTYPQLNGQIDLSATWPTAIPNFTNTWYTASMSSLGALSASNTYTVTLPKEIFPDNVILSGGGGTVAVAQYTIDITAECPSGNAAIKLTFVKQ